MMNTLNIPTRREETKTILGIGLPLTAAWVAEMAMFITDMIMVGRLGSKELAAVGLAGDWFWVLLLIGMGIISIVGVIAAQCLGAGDRQGVIDACDQGMIAATITSVPVMIGVWYLGPVLAFAKQDVEVVSLITGYAKILTWSVLPALWWVVLRNYVTALAKSAIIGWVTFIGLGLNVALNYTLIYGKFGLPALGVVGAGIGTTVVTWLMFFALASVVLKSKALQDFRPRIIPRHIDKALLTEIFRLGVPISLTQVLNGAMFTVAAVIVGMISAAALAAQQIIYSVIYLSLCAPGGLGEAVRVRVAYGVGLKSISSSKQSAYISFFLAGLAALMAATVIWLFPETLVGIFLDTKDPDSLTVLRLSNELSFYAGMFLLLEGVLLVMANAVRGMRDTRAPLWISMAGYWGIGMTTGMILCFPLGYGASGLWSGMVLGVLLADILMYWRFTNRITNARAVLNAT